MPPVHRVTRPSDDPRRAGQTRSVLPRDLSPMLATTAALPTGAGWSAEVKWDGVRALVAVGPHGSRATSRNGNDVTGGYPEVAALSGPPALLDLELVAFDEAGRPSFELLQSRMHVRSPAAPLVAAAPVTMVAFDVLHTDRSLLDLAYDDRRALLGALELPGVAVPPAFPDGAADLFASTRAQGLEGVVVKRRDSRYLPGRRSEDWVKVKHVHRQSALVCGWKPGAGGRIGRIGSLLLGVHDDRGLVYAGHVGTGFTGATLALLQARLAPLARTAAPYDVPVPREQARDAVWVEPVLVADVDHSGWTRDGRLRHPSYKGLRDDVDPSRVVREP